MTPDSWHRHAARTLRREQERIQICGKVSGEFRCFLIADHSGQHWADMDGYLVSWRNRR